MFSVFKSALGLSSLPFTLGEENAAFRTRTEWQLFQGGRHGKSGRTVSVFRTEHATKPALNALQCSRQTRHPNVLQFIASAQNGEELHIATEAVVPLADWLTAEREKVQVLANGAAGNNSGSGERAAQALQLHCLWGLSQVLRALAFLNMDCSKVHGLLCADSVFVTADGDWKLWGLDMVCDVDASGNGGHLAAMQAFPNLLPDAYKCPELKQSTLPRNTPKWAFDMWAFAVLCTDTVFGATNTEGATAATAMQMPQDLQRACQAARDPRPSRRPSPRKVLDNAAASFAHNPFVSAMDTLEHWALKSAEERERFVGLLAQHVATFPPSVCVQRILPLLVAEMGDAAGPLRVGAAAAGSAAPAAAGGSGGGGGGSGVVRKWKILALSPLAQIAPSVPPQQFKQQVEPIILKFFASKNRMTRVMVLQSCPGFVGQLDPKLVNVKIFPDVLSGFADTNTTMREETIKVMVPLAPVLDAANLERMLVQFNRLITGTQGAPETAHLRENCVICGQHVSGYLHAAGLQQQLLQQCWAPALNDPAPGVQQRAVAALRDAPGMFSAEQIARHVLPPLAPLLVAPDAETRGAAGTVLQALVAAVAAAAARGAAAVEPEPLMSLGSGSGGGGGGGGGGAGDGGGAGGGAKGRAKAVVGSWGRWAMSAVSSATSAVARKVTAKGGAAAADGGGSGAPAPASASGASPAADGADSGVDGTGNGAVGVGGATHSANAADRRPPVATAAPSSGWGGGGADDDDFSDFSDADDGDSGSGSTSMASRPAAKQQAARPGVVADDPFASFFSSPPPPSSSSSRATAGQNASPSKPARAAAAPAAAPAPAAVVAPAVADDFFQEFDVSPTSSPARHAAPAPAAGIGEARRTATRSVAAVDVEKARRKEEQRRRAAERKARAALRKQQQEQDKQKQQKQSSATAAASAARTTATTTGTTGNTGTTTGASPRGAGADVDLLGVMGADFRQPRPTSSPAVGTSQAAAGGGAAVAGRGTRGGGGVGMALPVAAAASRAPRQSPKKKAPAPAPAPKKAPAAANNFDDFFNDDNWS